MSKGLSFKKEARKTGLAGVGYPHPSTIIKFNKRECGRIAAPNWQTKDSLWRVRLAKVEGSRFKWVTLKKTFATEPEARGWLKENWQKITEQIELYLFED